MSDERENAPGRDLEGENDAPLGDGRYDAFILWAEARGDDVALSCTVTSGPHRGDVVDVISSTFATRDPITLAGLPCTLVVDGNEIRLENESEPGSNDPGSRVAPSGFEPPLPP